MRNLITDLDQLVFDFDAHENEVQNNLSRYTDFTYETYDTDEVEKLVSEFNIVTDHAQYLQRNLILLTSALGVAILGDDDELHPDLIAELDQNGGSFDEETRRIYYSPYELYVYIQCTDEEAKQFLKCI